MSKKKLFLLLSDLDGTILPINTKQLSEFSNLMKKISDLNNIEVKFCPISGRPSNYVLAIMDIFNSAFKEAGLNNAVGLGSSEQGSVILPGKDRLYERISITSQNKQLFINLRNYVLKSKFGQYFSYEPDLRNSLSLVFRSEINGKENESFRKEIFNELKGYILKKYGNEVNVSYSGCMEVTLKDVSKDKAIKYIINHYQKTHEIKGIAFGGDSENDIPAIRYMSLLSSIPGQKINVIVPSNALKVLKNGSVENWKEKYKKLGVPKCITVSEHKGAEGMIRLLTKMEKNKTLISYDSELKVRDDIGLRI